MARRSAAAVRRDPEKGGEHGEKVGLGNLSLVAQGWQAGVTDPEERG